MTANIITMFINCLIFPSIGKKLLIKYKITPITINAITNSIIPILLSLNYN